MLEMPLTLRAMEQNARYEVLMEGARRGEEVVLGTPGKGKAPRSGQQHMHFTNPGRSIFVRGAGTTGGTGTASGMRTRESAVFEVSVPLWLLDSVKSVSHTAARLGGMVQVLCALTVVGSWGRGTEVARSVNLCGGAQQVPHKVVKMAFSPEEMDGICDFGVDALCGDDVESAILTCMWAGSGMPREAWESGVVERPTAVCGGSTERAHLWVIAPEWIDWCMVATRMSDPVLWDLWGSWVWKALCECPEEEGFETFRQGHIQWAASKGNLADRVGEDHSAWLRRPDGAHPIKDSFLRLRNIYVETLGAWEERRFARRQRWNYKQKTRNQD